MSTLVTSRSTPYYPGLDVLRFLCVMWLITYHIMYWVSGVEYRVWGIYSVCIFFTISGASIHSGYSSRVTNSQSIRLFLIGRLTRLLPLFLLVLALETTFFALRGDDGPMLFFRVLVNASLLFGFGSPGTTSLVVGGWSLGIEMVFYLLFPICIALFGSNLVVPALALLAIQAAQLAFLVPRNELRVEDWTTFCTPLSFIFYFMAGCWVSTRLAASPRAKGMLWYLVAPLLLILIVLVGIFAESRPLVSGISGVGLSLLTVAVVYAWGRVSFSAATALSVIVALGSASYGSYLLHPVVYAVFRRLSWEQGKPIWLVIAGVVLSTLAISILVHRRFEQPVRRRLNERMFLLASIRT